MKKPKQAGTRWRDYFIGGLVESGGRCRYCLEGGGTIVEPDRLTKKLPVNFVPPKIDVSIFRPFGFFLIFFFPKANLFSKNELVEPQS